MKVFVFYENTAETPLANNLVKVLDSIGRMLVYGKVTDTGVLLEDWQNKPRLKMDCTVLSGITEQQPPMFQPIYGQSMYSAEFEYRDNSGYYGPMIQPMTQPALSRDQARGLVAMFDGIIKDSVPVKPTKPKVPKPNTSKTGVTIRVIDIEDDHQEEE